MDEQEIQAANIILTRDFTVVIAMMEKENSH